MIYADNAATTKMSRTAIDAMLPYLEEYSANYYRIMMEDPTFCDILPGLKSEAS